MTDIEQEEIPSSLSGNSRAPARDPLRLNGENPSDQVQVIERDGAVILTVFGGKSGGRGMKLDGAQQRELADWLAEGAEPDPRWTQPEPPEGALQFVTPSGYSELRLIRRVFSDGSGQGDWAMLALRAGDRIVEFALSADWQLQMGDWLREPHYQPLDISGLHFPRAIIAKATNRAQAWLASYCGEMDPSSMRFSHAELLGAFEAGEDSRDAALAAKACNTETDAHPIPRPRDRVLQEAENAAPERPSCKSCPFWEGGVQGDPNHGLCRVNPPVLACPSEGGEIVWPETQGHDFCGQHPHFTTVISGVESFHTIPLPNWDRSPESVAKAGTLTWAVAQLGAVRSHEGNAIFGWLDGWQVQGEPHQLSDEQLILLANKRATCLHESIRARTDRPGLICHDCGETSDTDELHTNAGTFAAARNIAKGL